MSEKRTPQSITYSPVISNLPGPAERRIAIHITAEAERAIRRGHPWLYESSIRSQSHAGASGDLAVLFGVKRRFVAIGLYDAHSILRVRILHKGKPTPINGRWFGDMIGASTQARLTLSGSQTTGYRLVHGENDGLPGLIIDRYDQTYVVKLYTAAWVPHLRSVLNALTELLDPTRAILRLSRDVLDRPQQLFGLSNGMILLGPELTGPVTFRENGLAFEADVVYGQKTGFFFDQRENRARVEGLSDGRSVLDVFAYSGAFSLYAARGGARHVVSLDASEQALANAQRNFELNRDNEFVARARHEVIQGDAFSALRDLEREGKRFDLVIIDPPSFTRRRSHVENALRSYRRLVSHGLNLIHHGGVLVAASCSSHVPADSFFKLVVEEAALAGRRLREIERTGHAIDHPITFREGAYLKCLFATVD